MAKKTATKTSKKTSTASRKKGPVKKKTTPAKGKPAAKPAAAKKPAAKKDASKPADAKPAKKPSGLDAAARVLAEAGEPLRCREIVDRMLVGKLWTTKGSTPHSTIYAAIIREIADKGAESRFAKIDRGLFTLANAAN